MLKVYRFEHVEKGVGPLCAKVNMGPYRWDDLFHNHSFPCEDENFIEFERRIIGLGDWDRPEYVFAWDDLDKLLRVLRIGAEPILDRYGFELMEYEIKEDFVVMDDGQVCFNKLLAKRVA